jgi:hypothetical protein
MGKAVATRMSISPKIVIFLHMRYDRYIITIMSVPYIGNIW